MKEVFALIPARSGSKGIPDKNIKLLDGVPLIAYSIAAALQSSIIDRVIVSTDSEEYAEIARHYGAEVPFIRPINISGDKATDVQFFEHAINWLQENDNYVPEYIVHLRPTTPFRNPEIIDDAISKFIGSDYSALRSCHKMSESSYKTFEIENGKFKSLCDGRFNIESTNLGRQEFPVTYNANGYVDVIRSEMIRAYGLIHGDRVQAFITEVAYEIDEISDIDFMEYLIREKPECKDILFKR
jgi:N-acylneuraminate cytidylyltransferase